MKNITFMRKLRNIGVLLVIRVILIIYNVILFVIQILLIPIMLLSKTYYKRLTISLNRDLNKQFKPQKK